MTFRPQKDWDKTPREALRARQFDRLVRYLRTQVVPFSPFYRRLFQERGLRIDDLKSYDDLARIPFTTKTDVVPSEKNPEGPRSFILQPTPELIRSELKGKDLLGFAWKKIVRGTAGLTDDLVAEYSPVTMLFTTGRSASSLPFFLTQYDMDVLRTTGRRIDDVLGLTPRHDKIVSLFPYAPHLAFWQVHECGQAGGLLTLSTGGGRCMGGDRLIDLILRLKPTLICGMPGYFYHLLRQAHKRGSKFDFVEKIALGGENVSPEMKTRIALMLTEMGAADPKVVSVFGFTEARQCWTECTGAANTGFHTSPDLGLFEIVDPETGAALPDETTGELVYTTLDGRGSALLRYRTGDIVEGGITHAACPGCGRTVPRIASHIRRVSNVKSLAISKVKGTLVNLNSVSEMLHDDRDIEEWQLIIAKENDDPLEVDTLKLVCALRVGRDPEEFRARIQRSMADLTEVRFNDVAVTSLDDVLTRIGMETNTKEERISDKRPKAPTTAGASPHGK